MLVLTQPIIRNFKELKECLLGLAGIARRDDSD